MSADQLCINDVSLRDGIQNEAIFVPFSTRLEIVEALVLAGVTSLQVAAFVNPKRVPQMLDIEDFIERLPNKVSVRYSALVLNVKGLERLKQTQIKQLDLSLSCSNEHSQKNSGLSFMEARTQALKMISSAKNADLSVRAGLQCVFGCHYQGRVPIKTVVDLVRDLAHADCDSISLADSTGQALPSEVKNMVVAVRDVTDRPLILHLHDTLGLGLANFVAGFDAGVRNFDASLGGVGGCPFIPGATGNIAIEDVVHLLDRMGVLTGISLAKLLRATELLESVLGSTLSGKVYRVLLKKEKSLGDRLGRKEELLGTDSCSKNS